MSRILVMQNSGFWDKGERSKPNTAKKSSFGHGVSFGKKKAKIFSDGPKTYSGMTIIGFILAVLLFLAGAAYLYQVNSIATKGYELREAENKIQEAEKESNKLEIREVELRSMYNIEKSTEHMNFVTSSDVSYLDMPGPVAMK